MTPTPDPSQSPRLDRLLAAQASRVPVDLTERVFRASAPMLPLDAEAPAVIARVSFRWLAAAAALLLAAGLALRLTAMHLPEEGSEASLTAVIAVSGDGVLGEELSSVNSVRGAGFSDLDDEMQLLLKGRVDG